MACIQYPRKERGGVSLGSWEKPTIYREPPKEIFTKKKERVEEGDVTYNIRNDASRYNDAITNWQKGKNMMVQVDYQNRAPQTTTMNFGSASNPYKVNQAFRPPEFKLLDLQPLSRQQRPYVAGQTNIGSQITRNDSSEIRNDQRLIDFSIGANPTLHTANTNASREMGIYYDNHERSDAVHQDMSFVDITSALKGIENVELQKMFSYEQTPHGIVMVPLYVNAESSASGPVNVESQRHLSDIISYLQDQLKYSQESNQSGVLNYDAQRTLPNQSTFISTDGKILGQGDSTLSGPANYEAQRHLQTEAYIQNQLLYGQGTNTSGYKDYEAQRNLSDTLSYLQEQRQYTEQGTNLRGVLMWKRSVIYPTLFLTYKNVYKSDWVPMQLHRSSITPK